MQPFLKEIPRSTQVVDNFRGYNHNLRIGVNEFYDEENLSSDDAPVLSVRGKMFDYGGGYNSGAPKGIYIGKYAENAVYSDEYSTLCKYIGYGVTRNDKLFWNVNPTFGDELPFTAYGGNFWKTVFMHGTPVPYITGGNNSQTITNCYYDKEHKKFFKIREVADFYGPLQNCTIDGEPIKADYIGPKQPETATDGQYWIDNSGKTTLKKFSVSAKVWVTVPQTYVRIDDGKKYSENGEHLLRAKDGIKITLRDPNPDWNTNIESLNGYNVIEKIKYETSPGFDEKISYIVVTGIINSQKPVSPDHTAHQPDLPHGGVRADRETVDFWYPVEANNRIWTCENNEYGGRLLACALGDVTNWHRYSGQADDSYFVEIASAGRFTGSCTLGGKPCFFKEDCVHIVQGVNPPFSVKEVQLKGVQQGCEDSVCVYGDIAFYKSRSGICVFDGTTSRVISDNFGMERYERATAAIFQDKYYVNMKREASDDWNDCALFVYDIKRRIWHKHSGIPYLLYLSGGSYSLYALTLDWDHKGSDGYHDYPSEIKIISNDGIHNTDELRPWETEVPWYAETGILTLEDINQKYISKITVRMKLAQGSQVTVKIRYDDAKDWTSIHTERSTRLKSFDLPIRIKRCDHMQLRFEGFGPAWIYSIAKTIQGGSGYSR